MSGVTRNPVTRNSVTRGYAWEERDLFLPSPCVTVTFFI
jgi:hypothetical protein